ncbi:MAG: exonuclease VII small subunit [Candidatus Pelagibacter sp.]
MKEKNLPDDIKSKSLDELREILNNLLNKIETSPNLENSTDEYQKLIKINNLIEKKFQSLSKEIINESKLKINQIIKKNEKKIK